MGNCLSICGQLLTPVFDVFLYDIYRQVVADQTGSRPVDANVDTLLGKLRQRLIPEIFERHLVYFKSAVLFVVLLNRNES